MVRFFTPTFSDLAPTEFFMYILFFYLIVTFMYTYNKFPFLLIIRKILKSNCMCIFNTFQIFYVVFNVFKNSFFFQVITTFQGWTCQIQFINILHCLNVHTLTLLNIIQFRTMFLEYLLTKYKWLILFWTLNQNLKPKFKILVLEPEPFKTIRTGTSLEPLT